MWFKFDKQYLKPTAMPGWYELCIGTSVTSIYKFWQLYYLGQFENIYLKIKTVFHEDLSVHQTIALDYMVSSYSTTLQSRPSPFALPDLSKVWVMFDVFILCMENLRYKRIITEDRIGLRFTNLFQASDKWLSSYLWAKFFTISNKNQKGLEPIILILRKKQIRNRSDSWLFEEIWILVSI